MIFPIKHQIPTMRIIENPGRKRILADLPIMGAVPSIAFCHCPARHANQKNASTAVFLSELDRKRSEPNRSEAEAKGKEEKADGKTE